MHLEAWTRFDPQPDAAEIPDRYVGPAADGTPHPLALRAANELRAQLDAGALPTGVELWAAGGGKMFGVLVVDAGAAGIGFLRGFSGMLGRRWRVPGFVPPLFDPAAMAAFWPDGEAELDAMTRAIATLGGDARAQLEAERRARSQALWVQIQAAYRIADARGRVRTTAELFAPGVPPGGAGDCAGPKLVGAAHRHALTPVALAEIWQGTPIGARVHGRCYAPCERLCGPVLRHMLG